MGIKLLLSGPPGVGKTTLIQFLANKLEKDWDPETETPASEAGDAPKDGKIIGNYVSIHSSGFRDFLLKPEVLRAR